MNKTPELEAIVNDPNCWIVWYNYGIEGWIPERFPSLTSALISVTKKATYQEYTITKEVQWNTGLNGRVEISL